MERIGSGSLNGGDETKVDFGGASNLRYEGKITGCGVFGVELMCFPLCRKGSKLTLLRPRRLVDLSSLEKKSLQMWVECKDDSWPWNGYRKPVDPLDVLTELQVENENRIISPAMSDTINIQRETAESDQQQGNPVLDVEPLGSVSGALDAVEPLGSVRGADSWIKDNIWNGFAFWRRPNGLPLSPNSHGDHRPEA
jgi:hypothetical protein